MIFNLGLTANAAAAHENDLSQPDLHPSPSPTPSSPAISFANLPGLGLGLGSIYNSYNSKKPESPRHLRGTSMSPIESSSDAVGSDLARARSVRKQSSRPKTAYQLAHPAAHARHRRLKLRPKLLLQLQQLSQTPRPLPILDVLPSTVYLPRLARKFPTIFRGKNGLGPNDLIIVTSDLYEREAADKPDSDEDDEREVVGTICQLLREDALSKGKAEICLNNGPVWEATPLPNGSYEFKANTDQGVRLMRWVLKGGKNRRTSAPPGSIQEENKRFTFSVIDPHTRRHPVIASMTRNHLEVFEEYTMPAASSPTSAAASVVSDCSDHEPSERDVIAMTDDLRTLIVITSIWVAFREGWSHNFRYDDSGLALSCSPIASRHTSPTAAKTENDILIDKENGQSKNGSIRHRLSNSNSRPRGGSSPSERVKSLAYGSLTKRSNSTGAAFIERSNRRSASGTGHGRVNRHSVLPSPSETAQVNGFGSVRRNTAEHDTEKPQPNGHRHPEPEKTQSTPREAEPKEPVKSKRRQRLSSIFNFFGRKSTSS